MRNKHLYPEHWPEISRQCKERAEWQCERCHIQNGADRLSKKGNTYKVGLMACHKDHSQRLNPEAELLCLCAICHWWFDYEQAQLESWRRLEQAKHRKLITPERIAAMRVKAFLRAQARIHVHLEQQRKEVSHAG